MILNQIIQGIDCLCKIFFRNKLLAERVMAVQGHISAPNIEKCSSSCISAVLTFVRFSVKKDVLFVAATLLLNYFKLLQASHLIVSRD